MPIRSGPTARYPTNAGFWLLVILLEAWPILRRLPPPVVVKLSSSDFLLDRLFIRAVPCPGGPIKGLYVGYSRSTNAIENLQGLLKRITRNVKRWRGGAMVRRWVGTTLLQAEKSFRKVRGFCDLPQLIANLGAKVAERKAA